MSKSTFKLHVDADLDYENATAAMTTEWEGTVADGISCLVEAGRKEIHFRELITRAAEVLNEQFPLSADEKALMMLEELEGRDDESSKELIAGLKDLRSFRDSYKKEADE